MIPCLLLKYHRLENTLADVLSVSQITHVYLVPVVTYHLPNATWFLAVIWVHCDCNSLPQFKLEGLVGFTRKAQLAEQLSCLWQKKVRGPSWYAAAAGPYLHPAYSIMETVLVKVQLQICMLPNNSQIYCNCHCFYILIWQPVVTSMKCLFRYYSIYSKINRFWVKDAIQAPSCSVEVVV